MSLEGASAERSNVLSGRMVAEPSDQDVTGKSTSAAETARACKFLVILNISSKGERPVFAAISPIFKFNANFYHLIIAVIMI